VKECRSKIRLGCSHVVLSIEENGMLPMRKDMQGHNSYCSLITIAKRPMLIGEIYTYYSSYNDEDQGIYLVDANFEIFQ